MKSIRRHALLTAHLENPDKNHKVTSSHRREDTEYGARSSLCLFQNIALIGRV